MISFLNFKIITIIIITVYNLLKSLIIKMKNNN